MMGNREYRLEEAIKHLMSLGLIDSRTTTKSIAETMNRGREGVSAALNGNDKYFTWKFTKAFCAAFSNIISADWIWNGMGDMLNEVNERMNRKPMPSDESLNGLSRDELISLVKQLVILQNEQTDMYRLLIRQNEEMIRNGQERLKNITDSMYKKV